MGCTWFAARFHRSQSGSVVPARVPLQTAPASPLRSNTPGIASHVTSNVALVTPITPSPPPEVPSLWEEALSRLDPDDRQGMDLQATIEPSQVLHTLIRETEQKKAEMEAKQWVYLDKRGDRVSYAERFLTVLNKFVGIVDIAITHNPHVTALVWAGFRFLLQV